jgi:hypothetical protein
MKSRTQRRLWMMKWKETVMIYRNPSISSEWLKQNQTSYIWGSHSGEDVVVGVVGCNATSICIKIPTLRRNTLPPAYRVFPERRYLPTGPHAVTTQKTNIHKKILGPDRQLPIRNSKSDRRSVPDVVAFALMLSDFRPLLTVCRSAKLWAD